MSWLARDFEHVEIIRDASVGCLAVIVVHSTRLGPAFGGIRRWPYASVEQAGEDAWRLAEAMTLKCAAAGVPGGGGKAVLVQSPDLDRRAAYERIGERVDHLSGRFFTGPDVGTEAADLEAVARHTEFVTRPEIVGDLAEPTARGVFAGILAVLARLDVPLSRATVAVQGLGAVGWRLAARLREGGATVLASDLRADRLDRAVAELGVRPVPAADTDLCAVACDVFAPCALGGVIDEHNVPRLAARAVAGSANNVLTSPAAGRELFSRGILYAPDFVINAGALVHGASHHLFGAAGSSERVDAIGPRIGDLLDRSHREGVPPEVLAEAMARTQVARAEHR